MLHSLTSQAILCIFVKHRCAGESDFVVECAIRGNERILWPGPKFASHYKKMSGASTAVEVPDLTHGRGGHRPLAP